MAIARYFRSFGYFAASNPCMMIIGGLVITIICSLGMFNIQLQTDPNALWTNPNGRTWGEQTQFANLFGSYYRVNQFIFRLQDPNPNLDLFQKNYLAQLYYLQTIIETTPVTVNGQTFTLQDLCFEAIPGKGCVVESPMEYWMMNLTELENDPEIKETATCVTSINNGSLACMSRAGVPIQQKVVLGSIACINPDSISPCNPCEPAAQALIVTYLLNNDDFTNGVAMVWEQQVFEQTINNFNDGLYNFTTINGSQPILITYMAQRSISDELVAETKANAFVVVLSYLLMLLYIAVAIGSFPNAIHSGFMLGLGGILIVISSVVSSIGICSYFGMTISLISAEVVPFLILAIGVDNMFIISNSYKRLSHERDVPRRIGEALAEAGPSITSAAVCEALAFLVGLTTSVPALVGFCWIAAIAVLLDFIFQITVFVAFLVLDERRKTEKRYDVLFCMHDSNPKPPRDELVKRLVDKYMIPLVFSTPCQLITLFIFIGMIVVSIFGYRSLGLGLEQQTSVTEGSNLYLYFQDEANYLEAGPEAFIVVQGVNFSNPNDTMVIANMIDELDQLSGEVVPPVYSWINNFHQALNQPAGPPCNSSLWSTEFTYEQQIKAYINISIDSLCCKSQGICGGQYAQDMAFDQNGSLVATRFRFFHTQLVTQDQFINAFLQCRAVVDKWSTNFTNPEVSKAFTYSLFYIYFEQYTYIKGVALQALLLALGAVFLAIVILRNMYSAIFVLICVACTAFDMIGFAWLMNLIFGGYIIQINAVSVVNLITGVGLSVEFCVHIMLKYSRSKGTRKERAKNALSTMGSSVIVGITITKFLGISVLSFAPSTIFRLYYFRMYFSIVVLGSFHGLIFLPILLSLIGPEKRTNPYKIEDETEKFKYG